MCSKSCDRSSEGVKLEACAWKVDLLAVIVFDEYTGWGHFESDEKERRCRWMIIDLSGSM